MREVWLTARKAFTFGGTSYEAGQVFQVAPLVAVQMVTKRAATYGKPRRIDAQPAPPEPPPAEPEPPQRRRGRRVPAAPMDTRPEHPTVEALPPIPDAPAPNVTTTYEDY